MPLADAWAEFLALRHRMCGGTANYLDPDYSAVRDTLHFFVQDRACGICLRDLVCQQLDHDHVTGWIRGALCQSCNLREAFALAGRSADHPVFAAYRLNPPVPAGVWQYTFSAFRRHSSW